MPLPLNDGFQVSSMDPIDTRIILTKEQMLNAVLDDYPDVYFAFCVDDGQWYRFDYEVDSPDPETGNFKKLELGGSTPTSGSGTSMEMAAALTDAKPGDLFYNTDNGKLYVCYVDSEGNKSWVEKVPEPGEMMYNEETGKIMYFDGDAWREVGGLNDTAAGTTAPTPAKKGDLWLDTTQTPPVLKVFNGTNWVAKDPSEGEMIYDSTNDKILYFDGTEWKEIGGAVDKAASESSVSNPEEGKVYYMENGGGTGVGQYEVYEDGKWFKLAKVWEGTSAEYTTLGGDTWSTAHPDVICFVKD